MRHARTVKLLPWYLSGRLDSRELRAVEAHLAGCDRCQRELESLEALRMATLESDGDLPHAGADLLDRAMARIEELEVEAGEQVTAPQTRIAGSPLAGAAEAPRNLWADLWSPLPTPARVVVVAQLILVVVLGGALLRTGSGEGFLTLGNGGADSSVGQSSRITVVFAEGVAEQTLRETLLELGARLVDGPSAAGFYTLEVPIPPENEAELEALLDGLRRRRDVIRFAELEP